MVHNAVGMTMLKRVCVFAGSSAGLNPEYRHGAAALGQALAARGIGLVYGGAKVGLMGVVADAVLAAGKDVIGVIPSALVSKEVAHGGLTELRIVTSMHERKALMADLSDGFIALPGGWGTLDEMFEALTWAQLGIHHKPCGFLNVRGYFDRLLAFMNSMMAEGFVRRENAELVLTADSAAALLDQMAVYQSRTVSKWIPEPSSAQRLR
jgi:uncharacterized protein (TIGR00730 family)